MIDSNLFSGGIIRQIYRGGFSGPNAHDNLARYVERTRRLYTKTPIAKPSVAMHGAPRELEANWDRLAKLAADNDLLAIGAWGLDGERDNDGSPLTGQEKGECMGRVLAKCEVGLADGEGRYDDSEKHNPGDVTDEDDVLAMGEALRKLAPDALVGDQCWFAMDSHGSVRQTPKPIGQGGPFAGFPVDEFAAKIVNWYRFRQAYPNEAGFKARWGKSRYEKVFAWMDRDWAVIQPALAAAGLARDLGITIQTYGYEDITTRLMHCLLTYAGERNQPVIAWVDPAHSTDHFDTCVLAYYTLRQRGFSQPGISAHDAVLAFQRDYNKTAKTKLTEDGACGDETLGALGVLVC